MWVTMVVALHRLAPACGWGSRPGGDGIPDKLDSCKEVAGLAAFAGYPDTDGDGISDRYDRCPTIAGPAQWNGCPDSDGDGVPDEFDNCPNVPGLVRGCPDGDGDGITDADDKCPELAGYSVYGGCPDTDNDGIPDNEDRCPLLTGPAHRQGCPDTVKKEIRLEHDRITFVTGKSALSPASYAVLNEVIAQVHTDTTVYIVVDGYADNTGKRSVNKVISARRAQVAKTYLVGRGISPSRIIARGHGSSQPVASNRTAAGRAKNRRATVRIAHR
jgi:OmpA-OmpF porin, OOP family